MGEHDTRTGTPLPSHISAKWQDVSRLLEGLMETNRILEKSDYDAVLAAASLAFGFVFIHPFADGNGRLHRYLIHDVLVRKGFVAVGTILPVSAVIVGNIPSYRRVLESFSLPRLDLIDWKPTSDHNVEVLNETIDLYRYFDATECSEFLYDCIRETVERTIPAELAYLERYDRLKTYIHSVMEISDKMAGLLIRFLEQGEGKLSGRAIGKEFSGISKEVLEGVEVFYRSLVD